MIPTPLQRIWRQIDPKPHPNGCWEWTGSFNSWGYGAFHIEGRRMVAVHRWLYQLFTRPLGRWEFVLHRCDNPKCVNPTHMFLGNAKDNSDDMNRKGRDKYRGERNYHATLTDAQVIEIRARAQRKRGESTQLAKVYGVKAAVIRNVIARTTWKHLP